MPRKPMAQCASCFDFAMPLFFAGAMSELSSAVGLQKPKSAGAPPMAPHVPVHVPPRRQLGAIIPPPPRIVANSTIGAKTLSGTGLPAKVSKEQIVIHFLVSCRIRPVHSEITTMRPKPGASKTAAAVVGFDTPEDAAAALRICDFNVFDNDPSGHRLRWKHANLKKTIGADCHFFSSAVTSISSDVTDYTGRGRL